MEYIANNHIRLPLLGLGTFSMHGEELRNVVTEAVRSGYYLFDTATKYKNEKDLGTVLNDTPNLFLQSKVHAGQLWGNIRYLRLNKKDVKKSLALSSKRLGVSPYIYLLHSPFSGYEHFFKELAEIRDKGVVNGIGVCNVNLEQLVKLISMTGQKPDVIQVEMHPYHSNQKLIEYCHDHGILVEARSPLAHGDALPEWQSNRLLQEISRRHGKTIPQIILRWIIQQKVVVIVRSGNPVHIRQNMDIFDFSLTAQEMVEIHSINKNLSFGFFSTKTKK